MLRAHKIETMYPVTERFRGGTLDRLIGLVRLRFGDVTPCDGKTWGECLTTLPDGRMALWFNEPGHSTYLELA